MSSRQEHSEAATPRIKRHEVGPKGSRSSSLRATAATLEDVHPIPRGDATPQFVGGDIFGIGGKRSENVHKSNSVIRGDELPRTVDDGIISSGHSDQKRGDHHDWGRSPVELQALQREFSDGDRKLDLAARADVAETITHRDPVSAGRRNRKRGEDHEGNWTGDPTHIDGRRKLVTERDEDHDGSWTGDPIHNGGARKRAAKRDDGDGNLWTGDPVTTNPNSRAIERDGGHDGTWNSDPVTIGPIKRTNLEHTQK